MRQTRQKKTNRNGNPYKALAICCFCFTLLLSLTACGNKAQGTGGEDRPFDGEEISVLLPGQYQKSMTALTPEFEKSTGIKVKLEFMDWQQLYDSIVKAGPSETAVADVTGFRWDWMGKLGQAAWYEPLNDYLDMDFWQDNFMRDTFQYTGNYLAVPLNNNCYLSFANNQHFTDAKLSIPVDADDLLQDLKAMKAAGIEEHPVGVCLLDSAAPWFVLTKAYGGDLFDENFQPQFEDKESPGYRAMAWLRQAYQAGLIDPEALDDTEAEIAEEFWDGDAAVVIAGRASQLRDYYNNAKNEAMANTRVLQLQGSGGKNATYSMLEGLAITGASKHKEAAAEFLKWAGSPAIAERLYLEYGFFPSSKQVIDKLVKSGDIPGGSAVAAAVESAKPLFAQGAPEWFPDWEKDVVVIMRKIMKDQVDLKQGMKGIVEAAKQQLQNKEK